MFLPPRFRLIIGVAISVFACTLCWGQPSSAGKAAGVGQPTVPIEQVIEAMQRYAAAHPNQPMQGRFVDQITTGGGHVDAFNGASNGPTLNAVGDHKAPADFTGAAGSVNPPGGGSAATGAFKGKAAPENDASTRWWSNPLFWGGLLCFVVAGALYVVPKAYPLLLPTAIDNKIPIGIAGLGAGLWVAVFWPGVLLFAVLGGAVWLIGPTVLHAIQAARANAQAGTLMAASATQIDTLTEGLRAAADGIAKLPTVLKTPVLASIAGEAEAVHGDHETIEGHIDPTLQPFRIPRDPSPPAAPAAVAV